jgi:hypothetical protein
MSTYTEDALTEQPAIALLGKLGWETANCFDETFGAKNANLLLPRLVNGRWRCENRPRIGPRIHE